MTPLELQIDFIRRAARAHAAHYEAFARATMQQPRVCTSEAGDAAAALAMAARNMIRQLPRVQLGALPALIGALNMVGDALQIELECARAMKANRQAARAAQPWHLRD